MKKEKFKQNNPKTKENINARSLLSGAQEFSMMLTLLNSSDPTKNCWSQISKQLDVSIPSIVKNTFYSKATTYLKKVANKKKINLKNEEEKAKTTFYILTALEYLNFCQTPNNNKPSYLRTMITINNLSSEELIKYSKDNGISLNKAQLARVLTQLVNKYESNDVIQPINLPKTIRLPIDGCKTLLSFKKKKVEDCFDSETQYSLLFFLTFPRKNICTCVFKKPNLLMG